MKGYVQNTAPIWSHVMKRSVGPGGKISLDELYEQYGKKHNIAAGTEFVGWLRNVKLKDADRWRIILEDETEVPSKKDSKVEEVEEVIEETIVNVVATAPGEYPEELKEPAVKEMSVKDVVNLSVRKARDVLPKVRDLNLLKYAMQEANQLAGKDSLCRQLRKRIREVQIAR